MAHDVDVRVPRWVRLRTDDWTNGVGDAVIARCGFAGYGRWIALSQILSRSDGARLDVSETWQVGSLARKLDIESVDLHDLLDGLADAGAIDRESLKGGTLFCSNIFEQQQAYDEMAKRGRENGARGGRPKGAVPGKKTDVGPKVGTDLVTNSVD